MCLFYIIYLILDCVDENSYEEEMRLYLDSGDIIIFKKKKLII